MKLIQKALLCAGLCFVAHSNANTIPIYNSNFDAAYLDDGSSFSQVNNWQVESGVAGVHNPTSDSFVGEEGEGMHSNMLYMIDGGTVSQTLNFKPLENTHYKLTFDVGKRTEANLQDYTVILRAGDTVLHSVKNAVGPIYPGTFGRATVNFTNTDSSAETITLEVKTEGSGQAHFDNFELSYSRNVNTAIPFIRPVAFGHELRLASQSSGVCTVSRSLTSEKTSGAYMFATADGCSCENSHKVFVSSSRMPDTGAEHSYTDFYQCVASTNQ